jgi:anti-sigma regulatory factor (Ser/Thr protein kinase)
MRDPQADGLTKSRITCEAGDQGEVFDEAELLVSELAANAVLHGGPPIIVRVECDGGEGLRVSVTDGNPEPPNPRDAGPEAGSGRGLRLVDVISSRWGVDPRPGEGKVVWFRLGC